MYRTVSIPFSKYARRLPAVGSGGVMDRDLAQVVLLASDPDRHVGSGRGEFGDRFHLVDELADRTPLVHFLGDLDEPPPADLVGREVDVHVGLVQ